MSCERFEQIISAALDGEAGEGDLEELGAHLADCQACRSYRAAQLEIDGALEVALAEWRTAAAPVAAAREPRGARRIGFAAAAAILVASLVGGALFAGYRWGRGSAGEKPRLAENSKPEGTGKPSGSPLRGAYWVREGEPVPVADGLIWDRDRGLHSARYFKNHKVHTLTLPGGEELQWTTTDDEVRLVGEND